MGAVALLHLQQEKLKYQRKKCRSRQSCFLNIPRDDAVVNGALTQPSVRAMSAVLLHDLLGCFVDFLLR